MGEREAATDGEQAAPCPCTTCTIGRALRSLEAGVNIWLDEDFERQMSLAYLEEEVRAAVLDPRMPAKTRRRLMGALDCIRPRCQPSESASGPGQEVSDA